MRKVTILPLVELGILISIAVVAFSGQTFGQGQGQVKKLYFRDNDCCEGGCGGGPCVGISRMNLDGTGYEVVVQDIGNNLLAILVDPIAGKLYWRENSGNKAIYWANLEIPDGETAANRTDIEEILVPQVSTNNFSLDISGRKMYYFDNLRLKRANLDGSGQEIVHEDPGHGGFGMIYEPPPPTVPAISSTGLALLALAVCGIGTAIVRRQQTAKEHDSLT